MRIDRQQMKLILAPMEGLTDPLMRELLTEIGSYDWCVSEFIRVTSRLVPAHVIHKYCPEAHTGWKTASGTPLHVQFLGSDPVVMAENAAHAATLGTPAIDLNFGCPAKTVNKHRGGAVLLDEPELMYQIISKVRAAVPSHIPVSAKIRLGFGDASRTLDIGQAVQAANASWLTIHARTKTQGYKPPAYWHSIKPLTEALALPIIANGEIWTPAQAKQCQQESGCTDLMLGRGAVTRPDLVNQLKHGDICTESCAKNGNMSHELDWQGLCVYLLRFLHGKAKSDVALVGRFKQWLAMLTKGYPEAAVLWQQAKRVKQKDDMIALLTSQLAGK